MLTQPRDVLTGFFKYALEMESLEDTVAEKRIQDVLEKQGHNASVIYKPRSGGTVNRNLHRYTPELMDYIKQVAGDLIVYFGYASYEENPTGFF